MRFGARALAAVLLMAVCAAAGASAQTTPTIADSETSEVEAVVVTARRIGVPVWRVGDDRSAIVFVGAIGAVPEDVPWRTAELDSAVRGSRKVLHSATLQATMGDVYRILFRRGRWTDLPEGESLDEHLDPALRARLDRLAGAGKLPKDYRRLRPWYAANRLKSSLLRSENLDSGTSAFGVARRAARRGKVPVKPAIERRFNDVITQAANQRTSDLACLEATAAAAEAGPAMVRERARAWTRSRIVEVLESPLTKAEGLCWPEGEADLGPELRQAWRAAAKAELAVPGAVVAVVPLRYLAEPDGLLDDLAAQGYAIDGPRWRADQL